MVRSSRTCFGRAWELCARPSLTVYTWSLAVLLLVACGAPETPALTPDDGVLRVSFSIEDGEAATGDLDGQLVTDVIVITVEANNGVREVLYFLNGASDPFAFSGSRPFQVSIDTKTLVDGPHLLQAFTPTGNQSRLRLVATADFIVSNDTTVPPDGDQPSGSDPGDEPPLSGEPPAPPPDEAPPEPRGDGSEWFVAPWGSDGASGSWDHPFASLRAAAEVARPGDAIWLRGGVYDRVGVNAYYTFSLYGTAEAPIGIRSYPGEHAIIDGSAHPYHPRTYNDGHSVTTPLLLQFIGDHVIIEDITLRHGVGRGLYVLGYHNVFRRITSHNQHSTGLYLMGSHNLLEHIEAFDNNSVANGGNSANGISLIDGNHIRQTHGPNAETRHNVVRYALLYRNSDDGIGVRSWDTIVEHSISFHNGIGPTGNGRGFKFGGWDREDTGIVARYNISFENDYGFDTNGSTGITMYNNTSIRNAYTGFVLTQHRTDADRNTAHNNVSYGDTNPRAVGDRTTHTHNSWNLGITNPGFISLDPSSSGFVALATDSPLVDAGIVVANQGYSGTAPDIGALQLDERWYEAAPHRVRSAATMMWTERR